MLVIYKYVNNMVDSVIDLNFVRSKKNLFDQLTKVLPKSLILESSRGMWLNPSTKSQIVDPTL